MSFLYGQMAILKNKNTSIICPVNDGESMKIVEIAKDLAFDTRISRQKWGAELSKEEGRTFLNLKKNVLIVEIPGFQKENELKKNHEVYILDHHQYDFVDRRHSESALEQFAGLIGYGLNREELGIAYNDRGYIPLLLDEKYSEKEISKIRQYDLSAQGYTEKDFIQAEKIYENYYIHEDVTVVETMSDKTAYLADLHFLKGSVKYSDLLVLTLDPDKQVKESNFFGLPERVKKLHEQNGGFAGGDKNRSMYWGKVFEIAVSKEYIFNIL